MNRIISLGILLGFATIAGAAFYGGGAIASTSSLEQERLQFVSSTPASRVGGDGTSRTGPEEQEPQGAEQDRPGKEEKVISPLLEREPSGGVESPSADEQTPQNDVIGDVGEDLTESSGDNNDVCEGIDAPIATSGDNVYIAWWTNTTGNHEVMFRASADNGQTFSDKINLSDSTNADSQDAEIEATEGGNVIITWWERNATSNDPVTRISNDNGATFGPLLKLATNGTIGQSR
jgi:hypothetical protein